MWQFCLNIIQPLMTCVLRCLRLESLKVDWQMLLTCFLHFKISNSLPFQTGDCGGYPWAAGWRAQLLLSFCYLLAWGAECVVNEHGGTAHSVSSWTSQCSKQAGPTVWYLTTTSPCPAIRGTRLRYLFNGDMVDRGSQAMESGFFSFGTTASFHHYP